MTCNSARKISLSLLIMLWVINLVDCSISSQKVDLQDTRTFVISSDNEDYDADESEMIQPKDIDHIESLVEDKEKYTPLHSYVIRYNRIISPATSKPLRDLNMFMQNNFHTRKLQLTFDFKRLRRKNFKREKDESNDDYEEKEDESTTDNFSGDFENVQELEIIHTPSTTEESTSNETFSSNTDIESESENGIFENLISSDTSISVPTTTNAYSEKAPIIQNTQRSTTDNQEMTKSKDKNGHTADYQASTLDIDDVLTRLSTEFYSNTASAATASDNEPKATFTTNKNAEENTTISSNQSTENILARSRMTTETSTRTYDGESTGSFSRNLTINTEAMKIFTSEPFNFTTKKKDHNDSREKLTQNTTVTSMEPTTTNETKKSLEYEKIFPEYSSEIEEIKANNFTYNFTDDEIEKTLKNLAKKTFDFKKPRNCSAFESSKYGIQAIECAISDLQHVKNRNEAKKVLAKVWKITKVWLCIYVIIAIPCWCQKGWCCCCFRCKFCFPRKIIMIEKKYFSENPPGILVESTTNDKQKSAAQTIKYEPTIFEQDAYEKFESAIKNL
ncbi:uncharacterized protein LOC103317097 isoform X1 [Nasonia vitripennis]|uniref:Uncharacterized protein n=2 Tax=Nasonia vitripennis TaxID=7425 RepID=A0A7M7HEU8_NASVI|nr:uncharacterized protein LOC103317097 isoform X1 [Nasonia vitripennis]